MKRTLTPFDRHNLLRHVEIEELSVDDILIDEDDFRLLATEKELSIFRLKNIPTDKAETDMVAQRKPMKEKDFLKYGLTKDEFRNELRKERFDELILEGHRWFDLVRWKILVKTIDVEKKGITKRNYLFPIPDSQITLNPNLTQNWGYSGETSNSPYEAYE